MLNDEKEERIRMTEEALKPIRERSNGIAFNQHSPLDLIQKETLE